MVEIDLGYCVVRVHGEVDQKRLQEATARFLQNIKKRGKKDGKEKN